MTKLWMSVFLIVASAGCAPRSNPNNSTCGSSNCQGCCNKDGQCVTAPTNVNAQCGRGGVACFDCAAAGTTCNTNSGTCIGECSPDSCGGCCDELTKECRQGILDTECGNGGVACATCADGENCTVDTATGGSCVAGGTTPGPGTGSTPGTGTCSVPDCSTECFITDTGNAVERCVEGNLNVTECGISTTTNRTYKKDLDNAKCYQCVGAAAGAQAGYLGGWIPATDQSKCDGGSTTTPTQTCNASTMNQPCKSGATDGKCARVEQSSTYFCCTGCITSTGKCVSENGDCGSGATCKNKLCTGGSTTTPPLTTCTASTEGKDCVLLGVNGKCGQSTSTPYVCCIGCMASNGMCKQTGAPQSDTACGKGGGACESCPTATPTCKSGVCSATATPTVTTYALSMISIKVAAAAANVCRNKSMCQVVVEGKIGTSQGKLNQTSVVPGSVYVWKKTVSDPNTGEDIFVPTPKLLLDVTSTVLTSNNLSLSFTDQHLSDTGTEIKLLGSCSRKIAATEITNQKAVWSGCTPLIPEIQIQIKPVP